MNQELLLAVDELRLRPLNRAWFIPVLLSRCELPEYDLGGSATLRSIQFIPLYENWRAGVKKLIETISPNRSPAKDAIRNALMLLDSDQIAELIEIFGRLGSATSTIPERFYFRQDYRFSANAINSFVR
jgi:hypothetical protein